MEPYSYFLPKSYVRGKLTIRNYDESFEIYEPVFSSNLECIADYVGIYRDEITVSDNGKSISFGLKEQNSIISLRFLQFSNNLLHIAKMRSFVSASSYEHKLYDYKEDIVFLFNSKMFFKKGNCTNIYISFAKLHSSGKCQFEKNVIVLSYGHLFNKYCCYLSDTERKLVIVTGNYIYGFKEYYIAVNETYLDILSYDVFDEMSNIEIHHDQRVNVTRACGRNSIDRIYYTLCGTKLFLVSGKQHFMVVYSLTENKFGSVYEWAGNEQFEYFYVYHKIIGNMFFICQKDGSMKVLHGNGLVMSSLQDGDVLLTEFGFADEIFVFMHVDYFDRILIFVVALNSNELLVFDFLQRKIIGKFVAPDNVDIVNVKTNWSGEEAFLLLKKHADVENKLNLNILILNSRSSLKCISKLAVFQFYSSKELKEIEFPKMLKREMNLL